MAGVKPLYIIKAEITAVPFLIAWSDLDTYTNEF